MNIAEFAIKKSVITWTITLIFLVAGMVAFNNLARLEDPEFTIKNAIIATPYPGATAEEVEEEVTDVIERAVQEMGQLWWVESTSRRGMSSVKVRIKDKYDKYSLPQVWDELRRKVTDYQVRLPPGAGPSLVNDDFGDVYGVYLVLTGEGYTMAELKETAKMLRRELLHATDAKRIVLWGEHNEVVYVEMSRTKMATLGISQKDIYQALSAKNLPADAGRLALGHDYIAIHPAGEFDSEQEFGELLVSPRGSDRLVFLRDVAEIRRGYVDPPSTIMRYDGQPGIALGISTVLGGNVVTMGESLAELLGQLRPLIPLGMRLHGVSLQYEAVTAAINGFMVNLIEAVVIVIVVLMIFMGLRSGIIIGGILFLTIAGTFLFMQMQQIILERISLGALIIALGMLVDNAIVVIDGMKVRIENGMDRLEAAKEVVGHNAIPLLGATVVAVTAFAAIGTSDDSTGEYCRSLFTVILISLMLSWVTAVTSTPLVGKIFLGGKPKTKEGEEPKDPYAGKMFQLYKKGLMTCIKYRWGTIAVIVGLFVASMIGFGQVSRMFFPNSTRPQFFVDVFLPEGTHIRDTEQVMARAEEYLLGRDEVTHVSTAIGGGDLRFLLTYEPPVSSSSTGVLFCDVEDYNIIEKLAPELQEDLEELLPNAVVNVRKFRLGPGEGGRIQLRISGPDRAELRRMASTAMNILRAENALGVRSEWRNPVKVVRPQLAEAQARQLGLDRPEVAAALQAAFDGFQTGVYRERDELLAIKARAPEEERTNVDNIRDLQIWSPAAGRMIPLSQILTGFTTEIEDERIWRRDRVTTQRVHADPNHGELPSELFQRIKPQIEQALNVDVGAYFGRQMENPFEGYTANTIPVKNLDRMPIKDKPGYYIAWGGEAEDTARAQGALAKSIPIFLGIMVLTVVFLFNAVRQPLIIWLTVPLAIIGVTAGLLIFKQPFGFMALLGVMSLSGMLIKNAIVLIEEIQLQMKEKDPFWAVVDSGVARMRPVSMAALTTILGMIPLLTDAFFVSMAVAVMAGLFVATVLTLIVVPVLYTILFRISYKGDEKPA
jgi:multidrug efflux pump subunit AcrB